MSVRENQQPAAAWKILISPFPVSPSGEVGAAGFPPRRKHATRQQKALALIAAAGSPQEGLLLPPFVISASESPGGTREDR